MRLVTLDCAPYRHPGVVLGTGEILDLVRYAAHEPLAHLVATSVRAIITAGPEALAIVRRLADRAEGAKGDALRETGAIIPAATAKFTAPIPDASLVLSTGSAYRAHMKEMKVPAPSQPSGFIKYAGSLTGPGCPIVIPPQAPDMVDFEGEFSLVIGRSCHNVSAADAMSYVMGYTIMNDVSARDWVKDFLAQTHPMAASRGAGLNTLGKQFPTFTPIGPAVVTADEVGDPHDLQLTTRLNGEVMQSAHTSDLIFRIAETVAHFSKWYRFNPGDIISTGSPDGVGYARNPQVFMQPGDTISVEVSRVGVLSNPIVAA